MARTWLARGEPVVPLEELKRGRDLANETRQYAIDQTSLREMLRAKFINPMLGIYAAHLMMIAPDPDEALLREVAENLKILLGDHPDVTAIELWLDAKNAAPPFLSPPMLRSSWSILVNRSLVDQKLVPPGSYTLRITGRLWGSGPWLVWRTPSPALAPATAADAGADALTEEVLRALYADLSRLLSKENVSKLIGAETIDKQLTDVESSVLSYTANIVQGQMLAQTLSRQLER